MGPEGSVLEEQAVLHVRSGQLLKGTLLDFHPAAEAAYLRPEADPDGKQVQVSLSDIKAIYYVRSLSGNREHKKKRYFQPKATGGKRVMVRFKDGEILCGFIEGELPWKDGFITARDPNVKGFFVYPADSEGNNLRIFVVASAVEDVRRL